MWGFTNTRDAQYGPQTIGPPNFGNPHMDAHSKVFGPSALNPKPKTQNLRELSPQNRTLSTIPSRCFGASGQRIGPRLSGVTPYRPFSTQGPILYRVLGGGGFMAGRYLGKLGEAWGALGSSGHRETLSTFRDTGNSFGKQTPLSEAIDPKPETRNPKFLNPKPSTLES